MNVCPPARHIALPLLAALAFASACGGPSEQEQAARLGRLAFIEGGDLWIRDLPGGVPQRLTREGGNRRPRWSASGQWLAFRHDQQLWIVGAAGGTPSPIAAGVAVTTFAWSPTSDTLAYSTRTGGVFLAAPPAWSPRDLLTSAAGELREIQGIEWNPHGRWIAFAARGAAQGESGADLRHTGGLWRVRTDGEQLTEIYPAGAAADTAGQPVGALLAGWTPDARSLLFWSDPQSASLLADGTSLKQVATSGGAPREIVRSMLPYSDFLAPSPDGSQLLVARGAGRETWSHKRLVRVDLETGDAVALTAESESAFAPAWHPSGQRITYVAGPDRGFRGAGAEAKAAAAERRIWIVNPDGSNKRQFVSSGGYRDERPLWSADGSHLLFARLDPADHASLWLMKADGSGVEAVAEKLSPSPGWFGNYGHIDWGEHFDWWRPEAPAAE